MTTRDNHITSFIISSHTSATANNGLLLVGAGLLLGSLLTTLVANTWLQQRHQPQALQSSASNSSPRHPPHSQAAAIQQHLQETQTPAIALGIAVQAYDEDHGTFLTLQAPLSRNTNVHGTAFAGSLYSVAVLASYYLARQYLINQGGNDMLQQYTLVAKAANIRYRKPVTTPYIVATSVLPTSSSTSNNNINNNKDKSALQTFVTQLQTVGKATLTVSGTIQIPNNNGPADDESTMVQAVEYAVECCAYKPRK